jgi:hypothetical protein
VTEAEIADVSMKQGKPKTARVMELREGKKGSCPKAYRRSMAQMTACFPTLAC